MDEIKFVMKCFVFAALLLVLTQVKTKDATIESHIEAALVSSQVSNFVNKTAAGGAKLLKDAGHYASESYMNWKRGEAADSASVTEKNKSKTQLSAKSESKTSRVQTEPIADEISDSENIESIESE